jgi:hypothetical protein
MIAEPRQLLLQGVGPGPLSRSLPLRGYGVGRCFIAFSAPRLLGSALLADMGCQLGTRFLGFLTGAVDLGVTAIFGGPQMGDLRLALGRGTDFLLLQARPYGDDFLFQAIAAVMCGVALTREVGELVGLLIDQALGLGQSGFGQRAGFPSVDQGGPLVLGFFQNGGAFTLQGETILGQRLALLLHCQAGLGVGDPQRLLP